MSESQLEKLKLERDSLKRELACLQSALPINQSCQKLIESMSNKVDPFMNAAENEWIASQSGDGCNCTVV